MPESYHVILTQQAFSDLEAIAQYIRQQSPQNAVEVADFILDAIDSLESMPERFRRVGNSRKRGTIIHALVVTPFVIYYRVDKAVSAVHILNIAHGAKRPPRRFG